MIDSLRNEVLESQKSRTDLLKWKLLIVAVLGAAGLGFGNSDSSKSPIISIHLILCLIPFACVYVDILCRHYQLRMLVISSFIQRFINDPKSPEATTFHSYEEFCELVRPVFSFEDLAQEWSTVFTSLLLAISALILNISRRDSFSLLTSSILGVMFTIFLDYKTRLNIRVIKEKSIRFHPHIISGHLITGN